MEITGRGAWSSVGGTLALKSDNPGPYYKLPISGINYIGKSIDITDPNQRAVKGAVKAYQAGLNRRIGTKLLVDGILGPVTSKAIIEFQKVRGLAPDGAIGATTSKALLLNDLAKVVQQNWQMYPGTTAISQTILCGLVTQESGWDAGAVGYVDDHDFGLMQISGDNHDYTEEQRLDPMVAFQFAFDYLRNSINDYRIVTLDDAIASYNLGIGGASKWITAGRPNLWDPTGRPPTDPKYNPRNVRGYITTIKTACAA